MREQVALGTATDPYQPIEGHYKLTRRSLERCSPPGRRSGLVTKGPMVVRDADLLAELGARAGCTVYMSVPTVDEDAWRALEPGTAHPLQRLRAVRQLRDAGVNAGVLMAPVVPGLHDPAGEARSDDQGHRRSRRRVHGRERHVPEGRHEGSLHGLPRAGISAMVERYSRLYAGAYAPERLREDRARDDRHAAASATTSRTTIANEESVPQDTGTVRSKGRS